MFHGLREHVDAVLVGTRTLGVERYGRILGKEERRLRRIERGQRPEPLASTITRSGEIPIDIPLFEEPEAQIVIFSDTEIELDCPADVDVVLLDPGEMTLTTAMRRLRTAYGVRSLLCEGGPTMFGALLHEGLVDELFLTISPQMAGGGSGPTVTSGPELPDPARLRILWLLERAGSLYARYGFH
jgi:5-amino-6-(5-phosphoribosylamino)uracil reductase